ncbi:MAG: GNAT family N-acetyltransferase [Dehalococcoidales bacterium]
MDTASVRPITVKDKAHVMHILKNTPEFLPPEVIVAEELIDAFLEEEQRSGYHIYVADLDGEIAGYVCYGDTPLTEATWDLYWIAVANNKQGFGIGRILMQHAEDDIKRMHGRLIMVETSGKPDYNKTRRFYERLNYQKVCQIPDYYAPGDDLVLYSKKIG